jgi:hypothetical protein
VIFGWKKPNTKPRVRGHWAEPLRKLRFFSHDDPSHGRIQFQNVSLSTSIQNLSLQIEPGSWAVLYGDDDFAKALFCDLCFGYILPEAGAVSPGLKGSDVSFIGRSNTTYGKTLVDHLNCGVKENSKELMEFVVNHVLSQRFRRHLSPFSPLEFAGGRRASEVDLDERDFLEIAEANVMLQRRKAAVIDVTTDIYQIAVEQGFRHSDIFLNSGKTLVWIVNDQQALPADACPWREVRYQAIRKTSLSFQTGSRAGYIN